MAHKITEGFRAGNNWLRKSGTELDLDGGRYRSWESIFGWRYGTWRPLPKADYLLLFRTVYVKCEACGPDEFDNETRGHFQLSLVHKRRRIILHESKNAKEVFILARELSRLMALPIRDAASDRFHPRWLAKEPS